MATSSGVDLLPLLIVLSYFVVGCCVFAVRSRFGRDLRDGEVLERSASPVLGRFLRHFMMWMLAPYERALVLMRVSPSTVTLASLACAAGASVALASGWFALGGWLYLVCGMFDILDGRVARQTGRVSASGAFLDSVVDRYAELLVFGGLAFYYRSGWVLGVVLAAALGSLMVSYTRARGEGLGVDVRVGMMQRPERLFYLGLVVGHAPLWEHLMGNPASLHPLFAPAVGALALLAVTSNITALRRVLHTMRKLDEQEQAALAPVEIFVPPDPPRPPRGVSRLIDLLRTAG